MTKRQRMPTRLGFVHGEPRRGGGLIGKSLKPKNSCQQSPRRYPLVDQKTDGLRLTDGTNSAGQAALKVLARAGLVSEIMKDDPSHAIGGAQSGRIAGGRGKGAELISDCQRRPIFASVHVMRPKTAERAQLVFGVAKALGNFQGPRPGCFGLGYGAGGVVQRHPQCRLQMHFLARIQVCDRIQPGEGAFDVAAALGHHR